mmetsp:Transcript_24397/g.36377  ORF Transcript_24397/g.36377 Transcript_24397/m.36377 type:complete len:274 (+) Transcript_24397:462-1283(+)
MIRPGDISAPDPFQRGCIILDAFCGCGGNAISFANIDVVSAVVCVDNDRSKLKMTAQNASIYGISPEKLILIESDACFVIDKCYSNGSLISRKMLVAKAKQFEVPCESFEGYKIGGVELLPECIDAIFLSPPWGGMDYHKVGKRGYDIATCMQIDTNVDNELNEDTANTESTQACITDAKNILEDSKSSPCNKINGEQLLAMASKGTKDRKVVLFLPRNTDGVALGRSAVKAGYNTSIELEQNVLNGKLKTLTAYFGKGGNKNDSSMFRSPTK